MPLTAGTKLGPYEIIALIGAGGMGEVYKAKDTRLDRVVAVKVLPEHLSQDPERRERLEREARAISSLNHPHICTLHDIGHENGVVYLVMEFIEGETLAERLDKGPLTFDEALQIAVQVADALDKAHRQGIVHRDLKPANIMLTASGVKLLDFGLAKLTASERAQNVSSLSSLPTEAKSLTAEGSIIGTLQYMAPEQLESKDVDARTDLFALGAVLYEMLTGRKAFEGESQASLIGAIMTSDPPPISRVQAMSPPALDHIVETCLAKKPDERWQTAADLGRQLKWVVEGGSQPGVFVPVGASVRSGPSVAVVVAAAIALSVFTGVAVWNVKPEPAAPLARFVVDPSIGIVRQGDLDVAITPDGTGIVYLTSVDGRGLVVRALDELEATTVGKLGFNLRGPFLSPDGHWVGYFDGSDLLKVSILGGPTVTICELPRGGAGSRGASWGPDDTIVFATAGPSGLWRVAAGGGEPEELTSPDHGQGDHMWPEILPGGEAVLFTMIGASVENAQIAVLSLDSGETKVLIPGGSNPRYAPTGHIVYGVGGTLRAVGFDLDELEVTSAPVPVLEGVFTKNSGAANFGIAKNGSLAYVAGPQRSDVERTLVWVDREGREEALAAEPRAYTYPRISPDGTRLALDVRDQEQDIWIWDFARETLTRLTFNPESDYYPTWTPDGLQVAFGSAREGQFNVYWKAADGTGTVEQLTESGSTVMPQTFSADGTQLVFRENSGSGVSLGVRSMDADGTSESLLATEFNEMNAEFSPDGDWLAYQSNASGQPEIYVRPFPDVDAGRWQISRGGGIQPLWGPAGRELFYLSPGSQLTAVSFDTNPFAIGNAEVVFAQTYVSHGGGVAQGRSYDVSPDGKRFLMIKEGDPSGETESTQVILVQNWLDELKRLVPVD